MKTSRRFTHPTEVEEEIEWLKGVDPADRIVFQELLHEKPASHLFSIFSSIQDLSTLCASRWVTSGTLSQLSYMINSISQNTYCISSNIT